jgi:acyl carrier protein
MTRDEVLAVIKRHFLEVVDGADKMAFDTAKSMKDYGATSLDMVEIVSASMRELKVKVPRTEFAGIKNIDGLAEVLCRAAPVTA